MANKETIQRIRRTLKSSMTFDDYSNYFIFIFPLTFIFIGLSMFYNYLKFDTDLNILLVSLTLISLGAYFFYFTAKQLRHNTRFVRVDLRSNETIESVAEKIETHFKLRGVHVDKELGLIEAYTKWSAFSWGEKMTLIIEKNSVLLNSRPTGVRQPITFYKDRSNINKLKEILTKENI